MRALAVVLLESVVPVAALAQGASTTSAAPPLLWVWVLVAVAVVTFLVLLLFRAGPRQRARAHAAAEARRRVQGHD